MAHLFKTVGINSITDTTDVSKTLNIDLTNALTETATTMTFGQTANRSWIWPDVSSTVTGIDATQIITNKTIYEPTANTITAAGTLQSNATPLINAYNIVATAPASSGVRLMAPAQSGFRCTIVNRGANSINVYPATGSTVDALGANSPYSLGINQTITLESSSSTQWYTVSSWGTGVLSISGTVNQITSSPSTGAVIVSIPSTFVAPGTIKDTTGLMYSTSNALTSTGSTQGTALLLSTSYNIITTVALDTGVRLPAPPAAGYICVVVNRGANSMRVYPNTGGQIDSYGTNAFYLMSTSQNVTFRAATTTQWYSAASSTAGSGISSLLTETTSSVPFSVTTTTDVLIPGMSYTVVDQITKVLVTFNGSGTVNANGTAIYSVYHNGVFVTNSDRAIQPPGNNAVASVATQSVITGVTFGSVIEIRVRSTAGQVTVNTRGMIIMGVA